MLTRGLQQYTCRYPSKASSLAISAYERNSQLISTVFMDIHGISFTS